MERLWKWSKRNPRVAVMIAGLLALTGFLLGAGIQLRAVRVQRDRARTAEVETQKLLAKSAADAGLLSMQRGQFEDAVRHFDQSLTLGAEDETDVRLKRVQALVADRRIDEAERELSAVTKLEIHDRFRGAVNLWKAQLAFERQADDEAARRFLVEADNYYLPKDEQAYVAGMLAESSPDAVDQFRAAVSLNPMHHRARRMLVTMLVSLARFDEALAEILTARQLYATDIDFALLESLVHSALGETQAANDTLAELVLSDSERESWEEFCRSVYFLTHEMDPDWHQQANRIDEVVQQYVAEHHPLLQARGIHLPPKIGEAFRNFSNHVHAYRANGDITTFRDTVATIVHAHPEGSLFVLLGELQLEDKTFKDPDDVTDALASCHASLKHGAFLGTAHISARIGIAGASLFKSVMFETDRENSIAEFREALEGIDLQLFDPTDRNMATLTMGAVRLEQWELAEKWMNRWVKALESYAPDDEATRSRRNDILWNKIVLGLRTERWLEVVQDCDVFLQENPDHPSAMGARETAIGHIRTSLNIADEEQLGDPPPRTAEPLSETE
jgi:tetratricopeptide (TPR) repeat protein